MGSFCIFFCREDKDIRIWKPSTFGAFLTKGSLPNSLRASQIWPVCLSSIGFHLPKNGGFFPARGCGQDIDGGHIEKERHDIK